MSTPSVDIVCEQGFEWSIGYSKLGWKLDTLWPTSGGKYFFYKKKKTHFKKRPYMPCMFVSDAWSSHGQWQGNCAEAMVTWWHALVHAYCGTVHTPLWNQSTLLTSWMGRGVWGERGTKLMLLEPPGPVSETQRCSLSHCNASLGTKKPLQTASVSGVKKKMASSIGPHRPPILGFHKLVKATAF